MCLAQVYENQVSRSSNIFMRGSYTGPNKRFLSIRTIPAERGWLLEPIALSLGQPGHQLLRCLGIETGDRLCPHTHQSIAQGFLRGTLYGAVEQRFGKTTQVGQVSPLWRVLVPKKVYVVLNGIEHE
jgi:hypothetical protein